MLRIFSLHLWPEVSQHERMNKKIIPNEILFSEIRKIIASGKEAVFRVKGRSMLPFLKGDCDCVRLGPPTDIQVGDILLFESTLGHFILHRLVAIEGEIFVFMGDGNCYGREKCQRSHIIGKVNAVIRENGKEVDCNSVSERRKARIWRWLLPVRRYLLAIQRRLYE